MKTASMQENGRERNRQITSLDSIISIDQYDIMKKEKLTKK